MSEYHCVDVIKDANGISVHIGVSIEGEYADVIISGVAVRTLRFGPKARGQFAKAWAESERRVEAHAMAGVAAMTTPHDRLTLIAELLPACPEPGIANGNDMCICGSGEVWPCGITKAAWVAAGLNPDAEIRKVLDQAKRELDAEMAADEAMRDVCQWHGGQGASGPPCPICEAEDPPCQAGEADR